MRCAAPACPAAHGGLTLGLQGGLLALHGNQGLALQLRRGALAQAGSLQPVGPKRLAEQLLLLRLLQRLVLLSMQHLQLLRSGVVGPTKERRCEGRVQAACATQAASARAHGGRGGRRAELLLQRQIVQLPLQQLVLLRGSQALRGAGEGGLVEQLLLLLLQDGGVLLLLQLQAGRHLLLLLLLQSMLQQRSVLLGQAAQTGLLLALNCLHNKALGKVDRSAWAWRGCTPDCSVYQKQG